MKQYILIYISFFAFVFASEPPYKKRKLNSGNFVSYKEKPQDVVLFEDIREEIIRLIDQENQEIKLAMYTFTDEDIADAIIDAKRQKVAVSVVLDGNQICNTFDMYKIYMRLRNNGIQVYPLFMSGMGIMHNKFLLLRNNIKRCSVIINGSYNYTNNAEHNNYENVMIFYNSPLMADFNEIFDLLVEKADKKSISITEISCPKCSAALTSSSKSKIIYCERCNFKHPYIEC